MLIVSILIMIMAIAIFSMVINNFSQILLSRITSIILLYSGALALNALYIQSIGSGISIYSGLFQINIISQCIDILLFIIGGLILIAQPGLVEINTNKDNNIITTKILSGLSGRYSIIILFSILGSSLLISTSNLLSMYLSIELQSFGLYILTSLFKNNKLATSAGLKYFLIGGLASCIILLGTAIIYFYTGLTNLDSIYSIISVFINENEINLLQGIILGFVLLIIGFLIKLAAAPLHFWAPDVYDESPTIITTWLTIMPKIAIFIFLLNIIMGVQSYNNIYESIKLITISSIGLKNLLLLVSLFSLIIGSIVGLSQFKLKRLLAFSTISHTGFLLLALAINSEQSIESFLFYIVQYSLTNLNTFLIILAIGYNNFIYKFNSSPLEFKNLFKKEVRSESESLNNLDINTLSELKQQFINNPILSISLVICILSMAGIPPLIGFFAKQTVLYSAIQSGYYFMSIIAIIVSVISASYYLKIIRLLFSTSDSYVINSLSEKNLPFNSVLEAVSNLSIKWINGENRIFLHFIKINESYSISYFITNFHSLLISTLTLIILLFILKPSLILNSTQLLSLTLFYY
jgi:NADH-ubiquinone oxidoreductase chain 2